jgi:predicted transport protein
MPNPNKYDIMSLTREIRVFNDNSSDLDALSTQDLKDIIVDLKKKELKYYIAFHEARNFLEDIAGTSNNQSLVLNIRDYFNK